MAKICVLTKKKSGVGNNVSHSQRKTKRRIYPNLQKKKLLNPATGRFVTCHISTNGLRTLAKWDKEGKTYDLAQYMKEA
ncbi:MAG: 50S ribosomal protein L28 [bacterium]|nr:50S ribosomal protein L28 [bacterium]